MYTKHKNIENKNLVTLSKKLSWLLRHGAVKEGLNIQANGFIRVEDILQHPSFSKDYNMEVLKKLVESDGKQRYTMRHNDNLGGFEIRANQGHTLKEVEDDKCLREIVSAEEVPLAVHGTYLKNWLKIRHEGLKRMARNHVHFATSDARSDTISGFRGNCEILIYLNVKKVLESGTLKLYRSDNNVILCSGLADGTIPPQYFDKVIERRSGHLMDF